MPTPAQSFAAATGSPWFLTAEAPQQLVAYLREENVWSEDEELHTVSKAGEGNMNVTLRVKTSRRTFILKQSRPWVAKFPDIPAPVERIATEYAYLEATEKDPELAARAPQVLHYDASGFVLLLEYLDGAEDMSYLYDSGREVPEVLLYQLGEYLTALHQPVSSYFPVNLELRKLNHAHIFDLPFRPDNGFPLDDMLPGLATVARPYQEDTALRDAALMLGETYLANGPTLVHGDFYPGSFMSRGDQLFVIDGEFAHPGRAEFDLGVLLAHLRMAGRDAAKVLEKYSPPAGYDQELAARFEGVEILRRLIGIAQLPLALSLNERAKLLEIARKLLLQ